MSTMGMCDVCDTPVKDSELVSHIAVEHPDRYEAVEVWPDGTTVVIDETLEPADFDQE